MFKFFDFFRKGGAAECEAPEDSIFHRKYGSFKQMGFKIEQRGDMVRAEIKKYEEAFLTEKLDRLGRLLGSVRLLGMHPADDRQVDW